MAELSYLHGISDRPLVGATIGGMLRQRAAEHGDREALVDVASGTRWTYRELDERVDVVAKAMLALGVARGDRIGIWAPNVPEWVLVQYAAARIGAILVNINPAYRTRELRYVLNQAGVRMLVAAPAFRGSDYRAMIDEVRPACPTLTTVIYLGDLPGRAADVDLAAREREL